MIKFSTDKNEIKTIFLNVWGQEFLIIQIKKSIENYKT